MVVRSEQPQYLTPAELAERLRISEATACRNIHTDKDTPAPAGKIPGVRIGRQLRVHVDDVEAFEARERKQRTTKALRAIAGARSFSGGKDYFPNL